MIEFCKVKVSVLCLNCINAHKYLSFTTWGCKVTLAINHVSETKPSRIRMIKIHAL